jgi:nucleoside-diphosphate-sugar epimerase
VRIFVAGGTGVLGVPTVRALVREGHDVRVSVRSPEKANLVRGLGAEPVTADSYDVGSLRAAMRGCDAAIRLSTALSGSMTGFRSKAAWNETNRLRTVSAQCIADAAIAEDVGTYIHESFYAIYRDAGDRVVDESSPTDDGNVTTMKAAIEGERIAGDFGRRGRRGIALRFGGFYSEDAPTTRSTIEMVEKRMLPQIGPGGFYFPSVYVDDAAEAVVRVLSAPSGIYNVCDDDPVRFREYLTILAASLRAKAPIHVPTFLGPMLIGYPWRWMSRSVRLSNEKLRTTTGWRPRVRSVREGWPLVTQLLHATRAA